MRTAILALLLFSATSTVSIASEALVTVESGKWQDTKHVVERIETHGGRVRIVVVPHFIFVDLPDGVDSKIMDESPASAIYRGRLDPSSMKAFSGDAHHTVAAWNALLEDEPDQMRGGLAPQAHVLRLEGDARILDKSSLPLQPPGANFYDVSEFMLGTVVLNVILPESDGSIQPNLEDWTPEEQDSVTTEILAGLDWWITKAKWRDLTFYTIFTYSTPTGYEPISNSSYDEDLWVVDVLENMGYTGATYPLTMYTRANELRDSLDTDWALLPFIVDSSDDEDGLFANGVAAYAYLGGPNLIMSYKNGVSTIRNMDRVFSHELTHSFHAVDEYSGSPPCTTSWGYLNVENQNSVEPYGPGGCAIDNMFCLMRLSGTQQRLVCYYTKGQIGWWDTDADSIPDILDTFPETVLDEYLPDPCSTATPTYTGTCWVVPVPNQNSLGQGNDITLELISGVQYRVDEGDWHDAGADDGSWDEIEEGYHFTTETLSPGAHIIEARAFQTCGNYDTTFASDTLSVATSGIEGGRREVRVAVNTRPNPSGTQVKVTYVVPGNPGEAVLVSLRIYDISGREIRRLNEDLENPGVRKITWDGTLTDGTPAPSGIYFVKVVAGEATAVKKAVIAR
jgi:hypothetical protein